MCARRVWAEKNSIPHDDGYVTTRGAMERGNIIESKVFVPALRKRFGKRALYAGRSQKTFKEGMLSTTPDALIYPLKPNELGFYHGNCVLYECKSRDPRAKEGSLQENYRGQVIVQMGLVRRLTLYRPTHTVICIINASFVDEVEEHVVEFNQEEFDNAVTRAGQIMGATAMNELKPEGYIAGGKECEYCPWERRCGVMRRDLPGKNFTSEIDPQLKAELDHLASVVKMRQGERDAAETLVRDATVTLKDRLREKGRRSFTGDHYKVSWTDVKGRTSIDMNALRESCLKAGINIDLYEQEGTPGDRLTVTAI